MILRSERSEGRPGSLTPTGCPRPFVSTEMLSRELLSEAISACRRAMEIESALEKFLLLYPPRAFE